tara:strand:+ start:1885 stop:2115 length:231 start_codon:yes stop_codon:yes gene_type:complete
MSRSLGVYQVKTKELDGNKCIPLMNWVGDSRTVSAKDIPLLEAIAESEGNGENKTDIEEIISQINEYGPLRLVVEY